MSQIRTRPKKVEIIVGILSIILVSRIAAAQESIGPKVIPKSAEGVDDGKGAGWHPLLRFTGNFALGQSENIPGTPDGLSLQLGYIIFGGLDYLSQKKTNEWVNGLGLELAYTKSPVMDTMFKSVDKIEYRTTYLYHPPAIPWLGPFVAFRLSAPMLPGYLVLPEGGNYFILEPGDEVTYDETTDEPSNQDGEVYEVTPYEGEEKIDLTGAFAPLTLRESVGVFAIPLDKPWLKTDFRLGFGAWETFVRRGLVPEDNEDTDLYELRRMQDSVQIGPELGIMLAGTHKEMLKYGASALFMQPVYQNTDTGLDGFDLLNMEFEAFFGVKVLKFLSIDYSFKAYKQPLIVDAWQIQNNLLISISFEVPSPAPPPPACPECPPTPECPTCAETQPPAPAAETAEPASVTGPASETAPSDAENAPTGDGAADETPAETPDAAAETTAPAAAPEPAPETP